MIHMYTHTHVHTHTPAHAHTHLHTHTSIHTIHTTHWWDKHTCLWIGIRKEIILLAAKIPGRERIKESAHACVLSLWICVTWRIMAFVPGVLAKGVIIKHSIPQIQGWHTRLKQSISNLCVCARHCVRPLSPLLSWLCLALSVWSSDSSSLFDAHDRCCVCTRGVVVICFHQKCVSDVIYFWYLTPPPPLFPYSIALACSCVLAFCISRFHTHIVITGYHHHRESSPQVIMSQSVSSSQRVYFV